MSEFGTSCKPCMPLVFMLFETSDIKILNNNGLRIQPCLRPFGHSKGSVNVPVLFFTADKTFE